MVKRLYLIGGETLYSNPNGDSLYYGEGDDDDGDCCCKACEGCCGLPEVQRIASATMTLAGVNNDDNQCANDVRQCTELNASWTVENNSQEVGCGGGDMYLCDWVAGGAGRCDGPGICSLRPNGPSPRQWPVTFSWGVICYLDPFELTEHFQLTGSVTMDSDSVTATGLSSELPAQCVGLTANGGPPGGDDHGRCDFINATLSITTNGGGHPNP